MARMDEAIGATPRAADTADVVARWAASGCMFLSGPPDSPGLGPPAPLVPELTALADASNAAPSPSEASSASTRSSVSPNTPARSASAVAAARAAVVRPGSCARPTAGSRSHSLARTMSIWSLRGSSRTVDDAAWDAIARSVASRQRSRVVRPRRSGRPADRDAPGGRASGERRSSSRATGFAGLSCHPTPVNGPAARPRAAGDTVVVDLSSLWAGPLCGALLAECGCRVVKVESTPRPDGARSGSAAFFDRMNARKRSVALDLRTRGGARVLQRLLENADVVIEASRPRALAQLGIDPLQLVASGPRAWVSITGHGYRGEAAQSHRLRR